MNDTKSVDQRDLLTSAKAASRDRNWSLAADLWDGVLASGGQTNASWVYARNIALLNSHRISEAEEAFRKLSEIQPDQPYGFIGHARAAYARGDWNAALERWDACITRFPAHQDVVAWQRTRATVLERQGNWATALEAWDRLSDADPDLQSLLGAARCAGRIPQAGKAAEQRIERLLSDFPDDRSALRMSARNAYYQRDFETCLSRWKRFVEVFPNEIEGYESAVAAARQGGSAAVAADLVAAAPTKLSGTTTFRCRVLLPFLGLKHDVAAGLAIFSEVKTHELDVDDGLGAAQFLADTLHFREASDFLVPLLERFPDSRHVVQASLTAILHSRGPDVFKVEKERLLTSLTKEAAFGVVRAFPRNLLSGDELRQLIDHLLDHEADGPRRTRELVTILESNSAETAEYLRDRLSASALADEQIFGLLLMARLEDVQRLAKADLGGVSWEDFRSHARATALRVAQAGNLISGDADGPLCQNLRLLEHAISLRASTWMNTAECYFDSASVAHWLSERVERKLPTSLIRLGDGEGNFLPYPEDLASYQRDDQVDIQQKSWWGEELLTDEARATISREFIAAIANADVIGIPPPARLLRNAEANQRSSRGVRAILEFIGQGDTTKEDVVLTSCHIHTDLDNWDLYRQILRRVRSVSTISCHDLSDTLAEQFGVTVRHWHRMPAERKFQGMFEHAEEPTSALDAFQRIMEEIEPQTGELILVAAGFLGKLMCDRIRRRGGIAVDIGSAADYWMGFQTRAYGRNQMIFDPSSSLIEGQPFKYSLNWQRVAGGEECHSDLARDANIAILREGTQISDEADPRPHAIRLIGHPRCGSKYAALSLQRAGIRVGHERLGEHGICSWMHAVDDESLPFAAPIIRADRFNLIAAYVRDPADAIPSIMLENTNARSFDFRRFHIFRRLGIDIGRIFDPLERATLSYITWMRIVDAQGPSFVLRVEQMDEDLSRATAQIRMLGIDSITDIGDALSEIPSDINRSTDKFALQKPVVAREAYALLPRTLRDQLAELSERYSYERL